MALDTSHGCWHGPYGQFMRWRTWLAARVGLPLPLMEGFYEWEWEPGDLKFERDYNRLTMGHDVPNRGSMWWKTLAGFESLGKGIRWSAVGDPLKVLLDHSDCDGRLRWYECKPIALRLAEIIRATPDDTKYPTYEDGDKKGELIWSHWRDGRGCYDGMIPATKRFATGCLRAFKAREDVRFR